MISKRTTTCIHTELTPEYSTKLVPGLRSLFSVLLCILSEMSPIKFPTKQIITSLPNGQNLSLLYISFCKNMWIHLCIHTYIHTYVHTYICMYIQTYVCTYIHVCDQICQKGLIHAHFQVSLFAAIWWDITINYAWVNYALKTAYYAFEQCSKIKPIVLRNLNYTQW